MPIPSTHWYTKPDTPIIRLGSIDPAILEPIATYILGNVKEERVRRFPDWWDGIHWYQFPFFFRKYQDRLDLLTQPHLAEQYNQILDFFPLCLDIFSRVEELNPGFKIYIAEVNYMSPGTSIKPHVDNSQGHSWWLSMTRRVHVPINTNAETVMQCGDMSMCMEVGSVYEFNNMVVHSGSNNGTSPRTHIVIDLIPEEYFDEFETYMKTFWKKHNQLPVWYAQ